MTILINKKRNLENILTKTEEKWLKILYHEIRSEFAKHPLPSHDHTHHFRVWHYAKELSRALSDAGYDLESTMIEKVIISVFFHDVGMTITHNPSHGAESRLLCERYLRKNTGLNRSLVEEILEAVEMHDDKEYAQKMKGINNYTILSVADDLDAYGAIGIYRYYEIYLLRGIGKEEIPRRIIGNIDKRFGFMQSIFGSLHGFIQKHETRKQFTRNYFNQFIQKDSTLNTGLISLHLQFLDQLVQKANLTDKGLDFILDENTNSTWVKKDFRNLIKKITNEIKRFHQETNKVFA